MVDSEEHSKTLKNIKNQELSLDIITLSDNFTQNATVTENSSESPQKHAVDPKSKKPQNKKHCSLCQNNIHSVSSCNRRLNMLKGSKPQSKSPTPSFNQHFKSPSNKYNNQTPRYHSRSKSNHYLKLSLPLILVCSSVITPFPSCSPS